MATPRVFHGAKLRMFAAPPTKESSTKKMQKKSLQAVCFSEKG